MSKLSALPLAPRSWPLRVLYPAAGLLVALAWTAALVIARAAMGEGMASSTWALCSLVVALVVLGRMLGQKEDALWETARLDPLTAIGNRRSFDERIKRELCRSMETGMPLALLAIDLDHLKDLNDRLGHNAGDRALRLLGEVLRSTCRSRDLPARFGGDEFMVIMPRSTADEAAVLAERIRTQFRNEASIELPELGASVSIGAADLAHTPSPDPRSLCEAADRALYDAKNSGRDRVSLADTVATYAPYALPVLCTPDESATACAHGDEGSTSWCTRDVNLRENATRLDARVRPENTENFSVLSDETA